MDMRLLGKEIKDRRLQLNLRMDDLAKIVHSNRSTLWAIENGTANCSVNLLLAIFSALGLSFSITKPAEEDSHRLRAKRLNSKLDKKINRFIIMCIEQYAKYKNQSSKSVYIDLANSGVLNELIEDYEDMHGMSNIYINDYIDARLERNQL